MTESVAKLLLQKGVAAAKAGNKEVARSFLWEATELDPELKLGWFWLAGVAETPNQSASYLKRVLELDPENARALAGLEWAKRQGADLSANGAKSAADDRAQPASAGDNSQRHLTVLVVDDSPTICRLVELTLERHGHRVIAAADGLEALARINDGLPDLILADIAMPRMDGYQLAKTIKENRETRQIPILMLSGKDGSVDRARSRSVGSAAHIAKPFKPAELLEMVQLHAASDSPASRPLAESKPA